MKILKMMWRGLIQKILKPFWPTLVALWIATVGHMYIVGEGEILKQIGIVWGPVILVIIMQVISFWNERKEKPENYSAKKAVKFEALKEKYKTKYNKKATTTKTMDKQDLEKEKISKE